MKLIVFPLVMLIALALLSMTGLGTGGLSQSGEFTNVDNPNEYWYDEDDHPVCFLNFTAVGELGTFYSGGNHWGDAWYWRNSTGDYQLYNAEGGEEAPSGAAINWDATTSLGLIGIVVGIMLLSTVVGLKIFGSGISETSVSTIIKGSAYLALWAVFSLLGMGLIIQIPVLGVIFYFFLTAMYTIGIIGQVGGGGGDDL